MSNILIELINFFLQTLFLSPLLIISNKSNRRYIWLLLIIFILNSFTLRFTRYFINFFPSSNWNWSGKIISILFSIGFIILMGKLPFSSISGNTKISNEEYKITLKQKSIFKKAVYYAMSAVIGLSLINFINNKESFILETLLFQLTMPGIEEELSYRGIYLALLNRVFTKKKKFLNTEFGWGLIMVSILFGLGHVNLTQGIFLNIINFLLISLLGFLYGFIAEASGSLAFPVIAHNIFNSLAYLIRVLK